MVICVSFPGLLSVELVTFRTPPSSLHKTKYQTLLNPWVQNEGSLFRTAIKWGQGKYIQLSHHPSLMFVGVVDCRWRSWGLVMIKGVPSMGKERRGERTSAESVRVLAKRAKKNTTTPKVENEILFCSTLTVPPATP